MGKFEQVTQALEALPEARREEIADILETLFYADLNPQKGLSEAQVADLAARVANPGPMATEEEAAAFFARFSA